MLNLLIRPARPDDAVELRLLARRAVLGLSTGFYDDEQAQSASDCITTPDTDLIDDGTLFVATVSNRIVGCGAWSRRNKLYTGSVLSEKSSTWLDSSTEPARIRAFFVDPDFARQGIARRLYEACRGQARLHGFKRFELMATLPGVPLYTSMGFRAEESTLLDLLDGTTLPAVLMSIEI